MLFISSLVFFSTVLSIRSQTTNGKKALIICSSAEKYGTIDKATGVWLGEAVHFYEVMENAGIETDLCSPRGGYVPIEPVSLQSFNVPSDWKYYADEKFRFKLGHSLKPEEIKPDDYFVIYFAGGHGAMFDFADNTKLQEISRKIYESNGVVSSVCHGAVGLLNIKLSDGKYLISGKKVTGFSNQEEDLNNSTAHVPFMTETELKKRGATYEKAPAPFTNFAITDGRLVTGQNPLSGGNVGKRVLAVVGKNAG